MARARRRVLRGIDPVTTADLGGRLASAVQPITAAGHGLLLVVAGGARASSDVTVLLRAWSDGNEAALEQLLPLIEAELRRLARIYMARERRGHTLQTTALINEAFVRLVDAKGLRWQDRSHFLGISARLMRRVLVDHARARGYQKRGGGAERVTLTDALVIAQEPSIDLLDLDRALEGLAAVDARKAKVVELRFFGGLSVEEAADVLHVSNDTIKRDWRLAKLWLLRELEGKHDD